MYIGHHVTNGSTLVSAGKSVTGSRHRDEVKTSLMRPLGKEFQRARRSWRSVVEKHRRVMGIAHRGNFQNPPVAGENLLFAIRHDYSNLLSRFHPTLKP